MSRRNPSVGVSKLSHYAADPVGYCRRKGGVRSRGAVRFGNRQHHSVVKFGSFKRKFILLLVIAAIGYVALLHWGVM